MFFKCARDGAPNQFLRKCFKICRYLWRLWSMKNENPQTADVIYKF